MGNTIETALLLQGVGRGGLGGLALEGEMPPLVPTVLLGIPGLNAIDLDAEPEPPDGKRAQAIEGVGRGEGHPVVGADRLGQAEFLEGAFEDGEGELLLGSLPGSSLWTMEEAPTDHPLGWLL